MVELLVGAVIGVVVSVVLADPLIAARDRLLHEVRLLAYRNSAHTSLPAGAPFQIGGMKTSWVLADGGVSSPYRPETVHCILSGTQLKLPAEVQRRRAAIERDQAALQAAGKSGIWNGPLLSLSEFARSRTIPDEQPRVTLTFQRSDFFTFRASVGSLDEPFPRADGTVTSLREEFIDASDPLAPRPFLAAGFGVCLVLLTSDNMLILARRGDDVGIRAGELDASVAEAVSVTLDRHVHHPGPDLYRTAIRGVHEELGITVGEDDVTLFGFGLDLDYYQWGMLGMAKTALTVEELREYWSRGAGGGKWETSGFLALPLDPDRVFTELKEHKLWSTGWVAIYWCLVSQLGARRVDAAAKRVLQAG